MYGVEHTDRSPVYSVEVNFREDVEVAWIEKQGFPNGRDSGVTIYIKTQICHHPTSRPHVLGIFAKAATAKMLHSVI